MLNICHISLIGLIVVASSFHCAADYKGHQAKVTPAKRHRRLGLDRDGTLSPIRIHYEYVDFALDNEESTDYFMNVVMHAVDEFFQSLLKVYSVDEPIIVEAGACDSEITIPEAHQTTGVEDADIVLYISTENTPSADYVAYAWACAYEDTDLNNIYAGAVVVNLAHFEGEPFEMQFSVMMHEITHSLGFSTYSFDYFNKADGTKYGTGELEIVENIRGQDKTLIKSPTVLEKIRQVYDCSTLEGYELESDGGSGTAGSHWDMRVAYNDYMISQVTLDPIYSSISLALLQDSGWYTANFDYTQEPVFGYHKGCTFHTEKCVIDGVAQFDEFCADSDELGCDSFHLYKAYCDLVEYSEALPEHYQYFSDSSWGGRQEYMDYCPFMQQYSDGSCRGTGPSETYTQSDRGESVCANCRCIMSTLSKTDSSGNSDFPSCYEVVSCSASAATIRVQTGSGPEDVECPFTSSTVTVPNMHGSITCPDSDILCDDVPCMNGCYGMGQCVDGECVCTNGSSAPDCEEYECDASCATCTGYTASDCTTCTDSSLTVVDGTCTCPALETLVDGECTCTHQIVDGVCQCSDGYVEENGACVRFCSDNCRECESTDADSCTACYDTMVLSGTTCTCEFGYTQVSDNECEASAVALLVSLVLFTLI